MIILKRIQFQIHFLETSSKLQCNSSKKKKIQNKTKEKKQKTNEFIENQTIEISNLIKYNLYIS